MHHLIAHQPAGCHWTRIGSASGVLPTPLLSELCRGLPCKFPPCGLHLHDSWCPEGHDSSVANYRKQESLDWQALDLPTDIEQVCEVEKLFILL